MEAQLQQHTNTGGGKLMHVFRTTKNIQQNFLDHRGSTTWKSPQAMPYCIMFGRVFMLPICLQLLATLVSLSDR